MHRQMATGTAIRGLLRHEGADQCREETADEDLPGPADVEQPAP